MEKKFTPKKMKLRDIEEVFVRLQNHNPHPQTELSYQNPFTLLVAVVLSAQATDAGVNKATKPLFALADHPQAMVALGEEKIRETIKTIGLYRNKAKNVYLLSQQLLDEFDGVVPQSRCALESLPGVGRKTANVVLNEAFGQPTMAVDTHIFRVANRTGIGPGADVLMVEKELLRRIPKPFLKNAHHWLILHGRYVCKARKPECSSCCIKDLCLYRDKTSAS